MGERKRILLLVLIMTAVAVTVGAAALGILYDTSMKEVRARLTETAESQARLMEAMARFDQVYSHDYPEGAEAATIAQIKDAHEWYEGFGETGEFTLARRVGDEIVFILRHRHSDLDQPRPVPFDSELAEPMRRALSGLSGTVIGPDYRGETVLAAYEPVAVLNLGIVAKIDLAEIRRPFLIAGGVVFGIAFLVIAAGTVLFFRVGEPMVRHIEESEERFRRAFETSVDGMTLVAPDGHYLAVNPAFCKITGYSEAELLAKDFQSITHPDDLKKNQELWRRLLAGEIPTYQIEKRYIHKEGRDVWVQLSASLVRDANGDPLHLVAQIHDITKRRRTEEALRKLTVELDDRVAERTLELTEEITHRKRAERALRFAKEAAEKASATKSNFLAAASHDLRQPLQALNMFVGLLSNRVTDQKLRKIVKKIENSVEALEDLLNALLDISKLEAGLVKPQKATFGIQAVLGELADEFLPLAEEKGLEFRVVDCGARVKSDPILLERILRNLLSNAIRYTAEGRVLFGCRRSGELVRIQVWDTGAGIPNKQIPSIFEEFRQLANPSLDRHKGLGLGLSIVQRMATLLAHPVTVRSVPGKGSMFEVVVPLGRPSRASARKVGEKVPRVDSHGLVVLIEDDADVREALRLNIEEWGYRVVSAASGEDALAGLDAQARAPDIILADYRLEEGKTGSAAIRMLNDALDKPVPGILLTGDTSPDSLNKIRKSGFGLLHKPVKPGELRNILAGKMIAKTGTNMRKRSPVRPSAAGLRGKRGRAPVPGNGK